LRRTLLFSAALLIVLASVGNSFAFGQSVEVAKDYSQHGLNEKAKDILISALHNSGTTPANKAKALYLLGTISFDEGRVSVALTDWQTLIKEFPQTPEAKEISARLAQLNEMVTKLSDGNVTSAVARSYLSNGNFWSKGESKFVIDSSWLPQIELATEWYDRVILEFPGSDAAELAYEKKVIALLGSREIGRDGESYGLKADYNKYLPQVLGTFAAMESAFPTNSSLQALRYQIAQAYWGHKDWANTRLWLQTIIDKSNGEHTFYTELAKARLTKIEF
jgi:tetratricopeptide (TPR) repeat protein